MGTVVSNWLTNELVRVRDERREQVSRLVLEEDRLLRELEGVRSKLDWGRTVLGLVEGELKDREVLNG